jgi:hypothetical protein
MSSGREIRPIKAHDVLDLSISRRYPPAEYSNACFSTSHIHSFRALSSSHATLYLNTVTTLIYRGRLQFFGSALL